MHLHNNKSLQIRYQPPALEDLLKCKNPPPPGARKRIKSPSNPHQVPSGVGWGVPSDKCITVNLYFHDQFIFCEYDCVLKYFS